MRLSTRRLPFAIAAFVAASALTTGLVPAIADAASPSTLLVPSAYPTIQSAVDAAHPGDRIKISRGTYAGQVSIGKDLTIVGAGVGATVIRAPGALSTGALGETSIVEIHDGASVDVSRLTVSGPGAGTCDEGALWSGLYVSDGAHLDARRVRVTHIRDAQLSDCFRSGNGIVVGGVESTGTADIRYSFVDDYQAAGIVVIGPTSSATISRNVVTGPGRTPLTATGGIELVVGATGTVSHNIVSGNACGSPDLGCGPDWFNEFQVAGITADGPGTTIRDNLLVRNQVGIYTGPPAQLSGNVSIANDYFGLALQDGQFTARRERIIGGEGGVAVIAASEDTTAVLDRVRVVGTVGPPVQKFECCGFTATVVGGP